MLLQTVIKDEELINNGTQVSTKTYLSIQTTYLLPYNDNVNNQVAMKDNNQNVRLVNENLGRVENVLSDSDTIVRTEYKFCYS